MTDLTRDDIESVLLRTYPEVLSAITPEHIPLINAAKDGSFGFSYLGLMLYANGCNQKGLSTQFPQGLLYHDQTAIFGVGFFKWHPDEHIWHMHIVAPRGSDWENVVEAFIRTYREKTGLHEGAVYVRHLHPAQFESLRSHGYFSIDALPWDRSAPSEDETFNHRCIRISDVVTQEASGEITVHILKTDDTRDFKRKAKLAFNRFQNFLERNEATFVLEPYAVDTHKDIATRMVIEHFASLKNAVGSTPEDYFNLLRFFPERAGDDFIGYVGYLVGHGQRIPLSLFIGEKIDSHTVALYATFALRNHREIRREFDETGYSAISQYAYIRVFAALLSLGVTHADLGGSEMEDLDRFKRQLGAKEKKTYWAVKL